MYVKILVLSQLMNGPKHGYEIKKNINSLVSSTFTINNNVLYPMVQKFVNDKLATKKLEYQTDKPNKFVYYITEKGKQHFIELIRHLPDNMSHNLEEFLVRVSFFEYIDNADKQKILSVREKYLRGAIEYFRKGNDKYENMEYIPQKKDFAIYEMKRLDIELAMIDELKAKYH